MKEFPYYITPKFKRKLDVLIKQLDKNDVWVIVDGDEGSGKTNTAAYILYYVHCMTGREFSLDRFYFDSDDMFNWVKDNSNGLVNWDEAALGGLSSEWWNNAQRNLIKFAMTGRKKHHFFVLCIPRVRKLTEYLRVDRSHALVHMDTGKQRNKYGSFIYLTRRGKSMLNRLWNKKKMLLYKHCMRKTGGFFGYIPFVFEDLLDDDEYNRKKDEAISNIGKKKGDSKERLDLLRLKKQIGMIETPIKTRTEFAEKLEKNIKTLQRWSIIDIDRETHYNTNKGTVVINPTTIKNDESKSDDQEPAAKN